MSKKKKQTCPAVYPRIPDHLPLTGNSGKTETLFTSEKIHINLFDGAVKSSISVLRAISQNFTYG